MLYDGVCGLCNHLTQFLLKYDHRRVFVFASLQSPIGREMVRRFGGDSDDLSSFYVIASYQSPRRRCFAKSDAALFVAAQLGWPWKAGLAVRALPRGIRNFAYDVVARSRYRIFGRHDECLMPSPEQRNRFVD